jgi:serine/threonine protein kinase
VAAGLAAAHAQGVIHRDVKPSNIFLTVDGEPKVGDFGIARLERGDQKTLTMTGQTFGSVAYMAPEQATGSRVDARADLYSLGCVLYEMLAGRRPFDGRDGVALTYQHVHTKPVRVDALDGRISPELASLVDSLLEKDPADRPATADDVRRALTSVPATAAPAPHTSDAPERTAVLPSRAAALRTRPERPWWLFAALGGAILLSLFALANALTRDAPTHPRRSAQASSPAPTSPPATTIAPLPSTPQQAGAALIALARQIAATSPPAKHVADDIEHTVQDVLERLDEPSEAIDKLNELKGKVTEEADKGHVSSADAARLYDAIDRLAHTIPGSEGD